jgi:PAS domain S-box-containing protein
MSAPNQPLASHAETAAQLFTGDSETAALMRGLDWSKTPLGPIEEWPQSLKTSVSICLNSRFAIRICWGPELVMIYNDGYISVAGGKHPHALGRPAKEVWADIWHIIGPMLHGVMNTGTATWADDLMLPMERSGYTEECYFTFSYSPIRDESGGVGGIFTPVVETTDNVVVARRIKTMQALSAAGGGKSKTMFGACKAMATVLSANPHDVPVAAIYLFPHSRAENRERATLAASTVGALRFPDVIDFRKKQWSKLVHLNAGEMVAFDLSGVDLGPLPAAPWGTPPSEGVAVPILTEEGNIPVGFLLAGVSARKRLDAAYRVFFRQAATEIAKAIQNSRRLEGARALLAETEEERQRLRNFLLNSPAAIAILDGPEHRLQFVNNAYLAMFRQASTVGLVGKTIAEVWPELLSQGIVQILDTVCRTGGAFSERERWLQFRRAGEDAPVVGYYNYTAQPMVDTSGQVTSIFLQIVDVTENVLARQEIESREQQFRALANSIPQLAWMAGPDGEVFWFNERWYEYTGTNFEQMKGWGWKSVHDAEYLPRVVDEYKKCLESGEPFDISFPLRGGDGNFRMFLTRALPLRDPSGEIVRWFGTNTDVEIQRKAETALRLSEKLAAVGRLASSIAHEINNPLEAVTNLIYLANASTESEEARFYLRSAQHELSRVSQITNQTLRFHKQQSAPVATDVKEIIDSTLTLYRGRLSRDKIQLKFEARPSPPVVCYAGEIRQVVANLIGNALDAMRKGGTLRLRLRAATDWRTGKSGIRITIADTGHGMTPNVRQRIYEAFFTTKGDQTGTGLGLWVSAGIVDKHGGSMHVRSNARPGASWTAFTVILPLDGAKAQPEKKLSRR